MVDWISLRVWQAGKTQKPRPGFASRSGWRTSKWQPACLSLPLADFSSPPSQLPSSSPLTSQFCFEPGKGPFSPFTRGSSSCVPNSWWCFLRGKGREDRGTGGVPSTLWNSTSLSPAIQPSLPHPGLTHSHTHRSYFSSLSDQQQMASCLLTTKADPAPASSSVTLGHLVLLHIPRPSSKLLDLPGLWRQQMQETW